MNPSYGQLTINLGAIRKNYALIKARVREGCAVAAVVKANGYGLGAVPVTGALIQEGCRDFFVSSVNEALELRRHYKDIRILVLNGFFESNAQSYVDENLIPVLGSMMEIKAYSSFAKRQGRDLPAFLHFNTRMNRLGLGSMEADDLLSNLSVLDGIRIEMIMSHLACASQPEHPLNDIQYKTFLKIKEHFPEAKASLANSSGLFTREDFHFDMVRPGAALYGLNPLAEQDNPTEPVVSLQVPIIRLRRVYKGAHIGYGATYRFDKDSDLATIGAGYADGLFWHLSNQGRLYWKGYACPVRGRVSMDLTTIDVSDVPISEWPRPGDFVEVIGPNQSLDVFAAAAGTIGYEALTSLGNRYERSYVNEQQEPLAQAV